MDCIPNGDAVFLFPGFPVESTIGKANPDFLNGCSLRKSTYFHFGAYNILSKIFTTHH